MRRPWRITPCPAVHGRTVIIGNIAGLVFSGFFLKKLFALTDLSNICILLMIVFGFAAESLFRNLTLLVEKLRGSYEKKKGFNV